MKSPGKLLNDTGKSLLLSPTPTPKLPHALKKTLLQNCLNIALPNELTVQ